MSDQLALMAHEGTGSGAVVSPCGRYRYRLWRRVASRHAHHMKDRITLFVMLNPSTADAMHGSGAARDLERGALP